MKTEFTRGEWSKVIGQNKIGDYHIHVNGKSICEITQHKMKSGEMHANARLIAAAPDLFTALIICHSEFVFLQEINKLTPEQETILNIVAAAIKKATE